MARFAILAMFALAAPVSGAVAEEMGFIGIKFKWDSDKKAAEVLESIADSPAEKAGLKEGDVVTKINGKGSDDSEEFVKKVRAVKPGETLTLTVTRDGKEKEVKVKAAKVPENS